MHKAKIPRPVIQILLGASFFSAVVALIFHDFGLNLLAGTAGSWLTVLGIDVATRDTEHERRRPAHAAMLRDALALHYDCDHFLTHLVWQTVSQSDQTAVDAVEAGAPTTQLLPIISRLDLAAEVSIPAARMTAPIWSTLLPLRLNEIAQQAERFMSRYVMLAPPSLIKAVQQIESAHLLKIRKYNLSGVGMIADYIWQDFLERDTELRFVVQEIITDYDLQDKEFELRVRLDGLGGRLRGGKLLRATS